MGMNDQGTPRRKERPRVGRKGRRVRQPFAGESRRAGEGRGRACRAESVVWVVERKRRTAGGRLEEWLQGAQRLAEGNWVYVGLTVVIRVEKGKELGKRILKGGVIEREEATGREMGTMSDGWLWWWAGWELGGLPAVGPSEETLLWEEEARRRRSDWRGTRSKPAMQERAFGSESTCETLHSVYTASPETRQGRLYICS
jgi:hypothetical protein